MTEIMMQLGGFQFHVGTAAYDRLRRVDEYRWKEQDVIGDAPPLHKIGVGGAKLSLDGVIYTSADRNGSIPGLYQVERLRTIARSMQPSALTDGMGQVYGLWVITEVEEGQVEFFRGGAARKQEFKVELKKYPEPNYGWGGFLTDLLLSWL